LCVGVCGWMGVRGVSGMGLFGLFYWWFGSHPSAVLCLHSYFSVVFYVDAASTDPCSKMLAFGVCFGGLWGIWFRLIPPIFRWHRAMAQSGIAHSNVGG
jgi:hypothetical protein